MRERVFSGMRPTGKVHIGHLVGVLEKWMELQKEYDCFYSIVDWHAMTTDFEDPSELKENIFQLLADWLAIGLDQENSVIFLQSQVKEHAELHLLLSMLVPMPWLERNPTLKEQVRETHIPKINYGLMGYPVLQASDILMYKGNKVPVGVDQLPHLEIIREIVRSFNRLYKPIFPEPQEILTKTPKLLGIDGRKMSKSLDNCIYLADPPEVIREKVHQMVTDPQKIRRGDPGRPDICSVFHYQQIFSPGKIEDVRHGCEAGTLGCVENKNNLAKTLADYLGPYRERREQLIGSQEKLKEILEYGANKARPIAQQTMHEVREVIGLWS
ncbi:MAG: tryptophan--tRNA ligase [Nitrospinae bacterium RIFCSPLOWO2_12_FULL_45_22]|nr:MAG: tryptophan--tRNA ligase [Nitrospinae bacterium RIFCSPLOWO2_12_FULL_45_22]